MTPWLIVGALAIAGASACGSDDDKSCPADAPDSCPATVPSYATTVAPLIQTYCTNECHNPTGSAADQPLSTYPNLSKRASDAFDQLYQCKMPMDPAPDPTLDERVTLLTWFVCGAPNN